MEHDRSPQTDHAGMVTAYIGLGANLGDAQETVRRALLALAALPATTLTMQSSLFRTAPVDASGADFVNAVAQVNTTLGAQELLEHLQQIEQDFGRERPYRNAPRTLDLDLLLYGDARIDTITLTVPHPRLTGRAFTLIPLLQLDPLVEIPGSGAAHGFVPGIAGQAIQRL